ncbi:HNH endonuclease [Leptospira noguchii]|uniref:HNH endonuclease n=1 Tax=Leptospira noguchii TaxID=28182 RepID=UPI0007736F35|nr:HNH endonuclease signature motif containing protein [Leptospira noguchii]UOG62567.1 HNH endonuclease [Leptospira noguchii]
MNNFLIKITEIYNSRKIYFSYSLEEILSTYSQEPEIFKRMFERSISNRYKSTENLYIKALWIAANITNGYLYRPFCYFCGLPFSRSDYLNGTVHIDHFDPISLDGEHLPGNIEPPCKDCNLLKSNLSNEELQLIFQMPEKFFSERYKKTSEIRKNKLKDFSALFFQRAVDGEQYRKTFGITIYEQRKHQDDMKANYRTKWFSK